MWTGYRYLSDGENICTGTMNLPDGNIEDKDQFSRETGQYIQIASRNG